LPPSRLSYSRCNWSSWRLTSCGSPRLTSVSSSLRGLPLSAPPREIERACDLMSRHRPHIGRWRVVLRSSSRRLSGQSPVMVKHCPQVSNSGVIVPLGKHRLPLLSSWAAPQSRPLTTGTLNCQRENIKSYCGCKRNRGEGKPHQFSSSRSVPSYQPPFQMPGS
jgi:hypothetical protein